MLDFFRCKAVKTKRSNLKMMIFITYKKLNQVYHPLTSYGTYNFTLKDHHTKDSCSSG